MPVAISWVFYDDGVPLGWSLGCGRPKDGGWKATATALPLFAYLDRCRLGDGWRT